jgi:predicted RNase H-like nuclease (RuvC/YqgF family)
VIEELAFVHNNLQDRDRTLKDITEHNKYLEDQLKHQSDHIKHLEDRLKAVSLTGGIANLAASLEQEHHCLQQSNSNIFASTSTHWQ